MEIRDRERFDSAIKILEKVTEVKIGKDELYFAEVIWASCEAHMDIEHGNEGFRLVQLELENKKLKKKLKEKKHGKN